MSDFDLKIWRLHPQSIGLVKAEKTLNGIANPAGVKWCAPFSKSNAMGWWAFPPVDVDIMWDGNGNFQHKVHQEYPPTDYAIVKSLVKPEDNVNVEKFSLPHTGRSKFTWGAVEPNVVQIWTGCIFKTPPGWCLQVRSPVNFPNREFRIMEGILETDWMQYDIWFNLVFETPNKWVEIRRHQFPPLAQLVPVRRETIDAEWKIGSDKAINRDDEESNKTFEYWINYNQNKFGSCGKQALSMTDPTLTKDSTTYYKERAKAMGKGTKNMCPYGHG